MGALLRMHQRTELKGSTSMEKIQEREHYADLLEKLAETQDNVSFEALYKHFGPLIKAFALSSGLHFHGDHLPEELVQEVMLSIWRKSHLFDRKKAAPSTWIFTIARNQRIDMLRRLNKYQNDLDADDVWDLEATDDLFGEMRENRIQNQVNHQLNSLPIEQRQILAKVFLEDKSHQEVSDELNLPLGTVKSRVRLAMQKLKTTMGATEL